MNRHVTLFHSANSRSTSALALLQELHADYDLHVLDMKAGEQRGAEYLAINPMGKVPAILHGDALVTEQPAVFMYLAELYPEAGMAPAVGDPQRGAYLRWMVFYGSCFEPAVIDHAMKRAPVPPSSSPYGDFDTTLATLQHQLAAGPYLLGERVCAADIMWGMSLSWITAFGMIPTSPEITAYIDRVTTRPAVRWALAKDKEILAV
ncbi:glutathione S-transferase family protein [Massilia sp. R2A-15]|uniref:glutathione S-transferase family protein n=1 Tax=Massilia sp. R2A-15 TaxID=3064278 RepID=UPI002736E254|nr:glutathione S-transferase family protein [Massilia sp. R2A-15]WLI89557.1 glutathione S-transferase family protein [Massilia sp. R2A-15]